MGPTSFNVGDDPPDGVCSTLKVASMGRRLSTSETQTPVQVEITIRPASMGPTSFNVGDRPRRKLRQGQGLHAQFREVAVGPAAW